MWVFHWTFIGKESVFMRQVITNYKTNEKVMCGESQRQNLSSRSKRRQVARIFIFASMSSTKIGFWLLGFEKVCVFESLLLLGICKRDERSSFWEDDSTAGCNCSSASGAVSELRRSHDVWALHIQLRRRRRSHTDVERVNLQVRNHRRSQTKYNSSQWSASDCFSPWHFRVWERSKQNEKISSLVWCFFCLSLVEWV